MDKLQVINVSKRFENHQALDHVNITIGEGSIYGLLGPNGAGKTTLIRIINMITAPDEGEVWLDGKPVTQDDIIKIGYLPEERGLYKKMKVGEQAVYLARLKGMSAADARRKLKYWFERFDIVDWWNRKVEELSKGMQQKVQFIVTLLHEPRLLIFDEPFSGFDPINVNLLKEEILHLRKQGATIIFSTHNMASVEELCDHIALINKGKKVLEGKIDEVKNRYRKNIYEVTFRGEKEKVLLPEDYFSVQNEIQKENGEKQMVVKLLNGSTSNDLLQQIMSQAEITAFQEILPSVNEIFIRLVTGV
ncbi:ABC transporter ATP-binding protein [Candidatus Sulfidibacterium hydrothermale]|uniref:ABC transporter ATP-binding protein n=1 Tax=Candidatus Sulfidibacterium hydrothermale TaxID=2875962 RepID=UPI001F0AD240|nr:ABC transporter ATP-binding protein [Candidatus Sulfidibacterium hydrothermale]UBM63324.1 ABC transporter ATP-binding protein [Candidatus Sulfidibacterium hydrothermale]